MYDLAVVDPPWRLELEARYMDAGYAKSLPYEVMGLEEILAHHRSAIRPAMAPDHAVFLWVADQFLELALSNYAFMGYRRHAILIWDKGNGPSPAMSVRYSHEYLIWYYAGKFQSVADAWRGKFQTVFCEAPRQHSRKPDAAYQMIQCMYPAAKKLDVFSRERRFGWDQIGNECRRFA